MGSPHHRLCGWFFYVIGKSYNVKKRSASMRTRAKKKFVASDRARREISATQKSLLGFFLTVFFRRTAHDLFELAVKIGQIAVAAGKSDFRYHFIGTGERITCSIDA